MINHFGKDNSAVSYKIKHILIILSCICIYTKELKTYVHTKIYWKILMFSVFVLFVVVLVFWGEFFLFFGVFFPFSFFLSFFFFFLTMPGHMAFQGQGSDLSCNYDLGCSCGNARSLTHCASLGIKPASQLSQDATHPIVPQ